MTPTIRITPFGAPDLSHVLEVDAVEFITYPRTKQAPGPALSAWHGRRAIRVTGRFTSLDPDVIEVLLGLTGGSALERFANGAFFGPRQRNTS